MNRKVLKLAFPETATPRQEVLNQNEAARYLGISVPNLRGLRRRCAIPCRGVGRQFLFSVNALQDWLAGREEKELVEE